MTRESTKKLILEAMFLAMGIVLPMFFGQIPQIGSMLLPMHIPVFLCAYICGAKYAIPMSAALPMLRSVIFSRPNMYPEAMSIAFELAAYAAFAGVMYSASKKKNIGTVYISLCAAMVAGRIVRTAVQLSLMGLGGMNFTLDAFFYGTMVAGIPGIILQLILVPLAVKLYMRLSNKGV